MLESMGTSRTRRVRPGGPGLTRIRRGRGFQLVDPTGGTVSDPETVDRVRALAIPSAWTEVWICPRADGHIQAVGTDAAGRRQYLYHPEWVRSRDAARRDRMVAFAHSLPPAREQVIGHLRSPDLTRNRTLAVAFRVLDQASVRIGSEQYAVRHATYGLATLLRDHVHVRGDRVALEFPGKTGRTVALELSDAALARAVRQLRRRRDPDPRLLAWREGRGAPWHPIVSSQINDYLRSMTDGPFTAKDFRTWNATVLMAVELSRRCQGEAPGRAPRRIIADAVREVAAHLANTPAVARASYIDGRVAERFGDGVVLPLELATLPAPPGRLAAPATEAAVLQLLTDPRRAERNFRHIQRSDRCDGPSSARAVASAVFLP